MKSDTILGFSPENTTKGLLYILVGTFFLDALATAGYAIQASNQPQFISILGGGAIIAAASCVVGNVFGFLFGIPRSPHPASLGTSPPLDHDGETSYRPNSNLEEMSDWLTKILVGVGLTQVATIPATVGSLAASLAPTLGGFPTSGIFAGALVVFSATSGFIIAYIATRFYTPGLFGRADRAGLHPVLRQSRSQSEAALFKDAAELAHAAIVQGWTLEAVTQLLDDVGDGKKTFLEATQQVAESGK